MMGFGLVRSLGAAAVAVLVFLGLWQADRLRQREIGAAKERGMIEKRSDANAKKADDVRKKVERLPMEKLSDRYARD